MAVKGDIFALLTQAAVCDLTALNSSVISSLIIIAKWMVPYVAAWLIVEHKLFILCFFGSHASKKQCLIIEDAVAKELGLIPYSNRIGIGYTISG